jgi:hypothetical protein
MTVAQKTDLVCCVSMGRGMSPRALCFADGKVRTYQRGKVDSRLSGTSLVLNQADILQCLKSNAGGSILIPVIEAQKIFGWKDNEFDWGDNG